MKNSIQKERESKVIARGETSGHCHVVTGSAVVERNSEGEIIIKVGEEGAVLRHLLEQAWVEEGVEKWTEEHNDILLEKGEYKYVPQLEYHPYQEKIISVRD